MTSSWLIKRVLLTSFFALLVACLHWGLAVVFDFIDVFKASIITHLFLYFITLFVFILARKINDRHPTYTTETMLGASTAKMLLTMGYFFIVYLNKIDGTNFAYSFLGIYFFYLPFNAYMYLKQFKIQDQNNQTI